MVRSLGVCAVMAVALLLAGCMVGPDYVQPATKTQEQFAQPKQTEFTETLEATSAQRINPVTWWAGFKDSTLNRLLAKAASDNLSLQKAAVRIAQARAQLGVSEATLLPTFALSGSGSRNDQPNALTQYLNTSSISKTQSLMVQATWEIDFWGKYRRGIESTLASYISVAAAFYSADVSLASDVANTYINIRNFEALIEVAKTNLAFQAESLRIAGSRYKNGSTSLLDLSQAQSQYEQTKSQIPALIASLKMYQYAMSILLGETPDYYEQNFETSKSALAAPVALQVGIPKDLLRRRPDVLQAEYTAAAKSALIGVNAAALYPSFTLSGFFGFQNVTLNNTNQSSLFSWDNRNTSIASGFLFPVFYRGAITDQIRVQDAAFQQSILNYQTLVLQAQKEVQDSFVMISTTRSAAQDLKKAVIAAEQAAKLAIDRYKAGQVNYDTVILAQQQLLLVQSTLVQTNTNNLLGYVSAFKSLGGGWSGELSTPGLPEAMVSQMNARTNWGDTLKQLPDPRLVQSSESIP